jgi:hypothetical protein
VARDLGFHRTPERLRDFRSMVHAELWKAVNADRAAKHIWEERFGLALKDKCIDVARSLLRKDRRAAKEVDVDAAEVSGLLTDEHHSVSNILAGLDIGRLMELIRMLPDRQAHAAFLRWVEDRPVSSVAAIMGISEAAVYKSLAVARLKLERHPVVRELRDRT